MNQHTGMSGTEHRISFPDDFSDALQSSKREKFLFETALPRRSRPAPKTTQNDFVMRITVDAHAITELRQLILRTCGDLVQFMRVKPVDHATKMKVWLCLSQSSVDTMTSNIMRALPQAEFGKFTPLLSV
ncbi:hypothetical protein [Undibacterium sp. TJN19]|uniref:hypothetical protein n=1 Tax=Undibacterium sp. TJN19 TaxID=3413055 RepID=UPI003BF1610E